MALRIRWQVESDGNQPFCCLFITLKLLLKFESICATNWFFHPEANCHFSSFILPP
jgi:hypothetical protein